MKIVFLADDFPPQSFGGAGISTFDLAVGVKKAGHDVHVVTTVRRKNDEGVFDYQGLRVWKIMSDYPERWRAYRGLYNPSVIKKLKTILKELKPDIVHANNIHYHLSYHAIKISHRYAKGVVVTLRDAMPFSFGKLRTKKYFKNFDARLGWLDQLKQAKKRWNPLRNRIIRYYLGCADQLFAVSYALQKALSQNGINNVTVMHTGLNTGEWSASEEKIKQFKAKHNLFEKKIILYGGRLTASKGAGVAHAVFEHITKQDPSITLLLVGEGGSDEAQGNIHFTGWLDREEMKIVYAVADVVLVPSLCFDAFPRMVIEGMAAGKAVIGTCYGGAEEAIMDGVSGYIIDPFDSKKIAEKILELFNDVKKVENFGITGRERIEQDFNIQNKVYDLIVYYEELIKNKP